MHGGLVQFKRGWCIARGAGALQKGLVPCKRRWSDEKEELVQEVLVRCNRG